MKKCYAALKENGIFITFENFSPFTAIGEKVYLEKWKRYQLKHGKSLEECNKHIERYGKDYFPITLEEHINHALSQSKYYGFQICRLVFGE